MASETREELYESIAAVGVLNAVLAGSMDGALGEGGGESSAVTVASITDAGATGRTVLLSTDAAAARTAIGAGTSNLTVGTTAATAKAGNYTPTSAEVSTALKAKAQITALAAVAAADATDLSTAQTLANANKAAINAIIAALKA